MCRASTGATNSGTGCCGSPKDSVINGLAGWYGDNNSVSRANGERSLSGLPAPCGARDEAVMAIGKSANPVGAADRDPRETSRETDHITIDTARLRRD